MNLDKYTTKKGDTKKGIVRRPEQQDDKDEVNYPRKIIECRVMIKLLLLKSLKLALYIQRKKVKILELCSFFRKRG